jgi:hypothetical protein
MANPRLILLLPDNSEREFKLSGSVSIGRAADNQVCLPDETVSRYHAVVEERGGHFFLSDLGSVQGTTVNGAAVKSEHRLRDGDVIGAGDGVKLRFLGGAGAASATSVDSAGARQTSTGAVLPSGAAPPAAPVTPGASPPLRRNVGFSPVLVASAMVGALLIVVIAALIYRLIPNGKDCGGVSIISPAAGQVISAAVKVRVNAENQSCIRSISYLINGNRFAAPSPNLFEATLDPAAIKAQFPSMTDGEHELSISVETEPETAGGLSDRVMVKIDFPDEDGDIRLEEIRGLAVNLATRINEQGEIFEFDTEFLERIRAATREFKQVDVYPAAENNRIDIRKASDSSGLPSALLFVLAASRSRFDQNQAMPGCGVDPNGAGLWKLPRAVLARYGQGNAGDPKSIAESVASHLKDLMGGERDDFIYAVACFGESSRRIGEIAERADASKRRNPWSLVKSGVVTEEEANRVVCFFAAGIVAENPNKFGLNAKSIREVYR